MLHSLCVPSAVVIYLSSSWHGASGCGIVIVSSMAQQNANCMCYVHVGLTESLLTLFPFQSKADSLS